MKKIYLSKGFAFESKDLSMLSTNCREVHEVEVDESVEAIPAKIYVDATGCGDDIECLIQVIADNFLDVSDIADYYPVVEFTTTTQDESCIEWRNNDIDYPEQNIQVVEHLNMGSDCKF